MLFASRHVVFTYHYYIVCIFNRPAEFFYLFVLHQILSFFNNFPLSHKMLLAIPCILFTNHPEYFLNPVVIFSIFPLFLLPFFIHIQKQAFLHKHKIPSKPNVYNKQTFILIWPIFPSHVFLHSIKQ